MSASDVISVERLEALLRGDGPRTAEEGRRAALLDDLRGGSLHAPQALRARVLAAAPAPRRLPVRRPSRRLAFAVVPAALALAVGAALVHGIVGSGSVAPPREAGQATVAHGVALAPARRLPNVGSGGGAVGAVPVPPGFKTATPAEAAPGRANPLDRRAAPYLGNGSRLQHVDASLQVRVADDAHLSQSTTQATRIAASLGGWAQSVVYSSASGGGQAQLDLRIPVQNVRAAVARLSGLGTLVSQQLSVEDLQRLLAAQTERIAQLRRRVAALAKAVADPSLPDAQRVLLRIQLAEARRSLAQSLSARNGTLTAGTTANVSLLLSTRPIPLPAVRHPDRFDRMLHSAGGFLALEGMVALYVVVVLSPVLVLAALGWALLRARRRRDERRLLAT